jgi:hypothetical protein
LDIKFRPIGIFDAQVVGIEKVKAQPKETGEPPEEKWQISFACPGRVGSGDKGKTAATEAVAALIGGVVKAKVTKQYLHMLKSIGFAVNSRCTLHAAIDNYAIASDGKSRAANGLWFELIEVQVGDKKIETPVEQKVA